MIYDHEKRERKEGCEIQHVAMPTADPRGYALMFSYLNERELDYELARANGWYPTISKGPRVVIPCVNSAKFNYWQARALLDHPLRYDSPAIPRKDSIVLLWPVPGAYDRLGSAVVITEGPMDALAAAEWHPAIAIMGGKPSDAVLAHIATLVHRFGFTDWVIVPDSDNLDLFGSFMGYGKVQVVLPSGKDLAGMPRWEREKLLGRLV